MSIAPSTADEPLWTDSWRELLPIGKRVLPNTHMKSNEFYNTTSRGVVLATAIAMLYEKSYRPLMIGVPLLYLVQRRAKSKKVEAIAQEIKETAIASNTLTKSEAALAAQGSMTSNMPRPATAPASAPQQVFPDGVQRNNLGSYIQANPTNLVDSQRYNRGEYPPHPTYQPSLSQIKFQNSRAHRAPNMKPIDNSLFGYTHAGIAGRVSSKIPLGQPVLD